MPMSFSLTQMLLISAAYLAALFGVNRLGGVPMLGMR